MPIIKLKESAFARLAKHKLGNETPNETIRRLLSQYPTEKDAINAGIPEEDVEDFLAATRDLIDEGKVMWDGEKLHLVKHKA